MPGLRLHFWSITGTVVAYVLTRWFDEAIFLHTLFPGWVKWIYLPTGIRLLSTLLLGADGAIGLLIAGLSFCTMFVGDLLGALILLYMVKGALALLPRQPDRTRMKDGMFRIRLTLDSAYNNQLR